VVSVSVPAKRGVVFEISFFKIGYSPDELVQSYAKSVILKVTAVGRILIYNREMVIIAPFLRGTVAATF